MEQQKQIFIFKVIASAATLFSTLIGCFLPLKIKEPSWTSRAEALAGGVFLGAGLAHLLADSFQELVEVSNYPIAPAVCILTFTILTLIEYFTYSERDQDFLETGNGENDVDLLDENRQIRRFHKDNSGMTVAIISLYCIMCVHSVIEGVALGIIPRWSTTIAIFCAIIGHKPVEAFSMSLIVFKGRPTKKFFFVTILIYCCCTPIATVFATYVGESSSNFVLGLIAAFSAGTFLFVGTTEWSDMMEHKGQHSTVEKIWHFGMFSTGVIWMLGIAIVEAIYPDG